MGKKTPITEVEIIVKTPWGVKRSKIILPYTSQKKAKELLDLLIGTVVTEGSS